jgi:hypothetical protein
MKNKTHKNSCIIVSLPANTLLGFKALPAANFDIQVSDYPTDWTAIYPQLSLRQAIGYLPNQYDRGCMNPVIVSMHLLQDAKMIVSPHSVFGESQVDSKVKASLAKSLISAQITDFDITQPLMNEMGRHNLMLCILDSDDYEVIVPHSMCKSDWFNLEKMFSFQFGKYANILQVDDLQLPDDVLGNLDALADHLGNIATVSESKELQNMVQRFHE